jgi:Short C-terminal domain
MKFYVRSVIGLGLFFFAWAAFEYSIFQFLQVGTCSSTGYNRYGPTQVCPSGIGVYFAGVFGGVILGLIAIGIYATRGKPPGDEDYQGPRVPFGIVAWAFLFAGTAAVGLYAVLRPDAHPGPGGKLAAIIIAIVFIPMGLLPLLFSSRRGRVSRSSTPSFATPTVAPAGLGTFGAPPAPPPAPSPVRPVVPRPLAPAAPAVDGLDQLEKLKKLRDEGSLTEAEFEAAKAKILEDL